MRISARNQLKGKITGIDKGAVNSEITIELKGGEVITSVITNNAAESLGLTVGKDAYAVVKASNVMVAVD